MSIEYSGLTPSAIRAAVAECGAGTMEVSPALVLALLDAAEAGREAPNVDEYASLVRLAMAQALLASVEEIEKHSKEKISIHRNTDVINWYIQPNTGSTHSYWTLFDSLLSLAGKLKGSQNAE